MSICFDKLLSQHNDPREVVRHGFLKDLSIDTLCIETELTIEIAFADFLTKIQDIVSGIIGQKTRLMGLSHHSYILHSEDPALLVQIERASEDDIEAMVKSYYAVSITGESKNVLLISRLLKDCFPDRLARVQWWFKDGDTVSSRSIILDSPKPLYDEFYPWIEGGVDSYLQRYLDSDASLLFLTGQAGSGKTSLLRYFLCKHQLGALVTYEESLMQTDYMFVEFITSASDDVLIIEDADVMVASRENAGNTMINRFLNVSDGMIKFQKKKIIFTTNLSNFDDVDQALTRAGRCFDIMSFRKLYAAEAVAAAKVAGLPEPAEHCDMSLAELFNPDFHAQICRRSIGF